MKTSFIVLILITTVAVFLTFILFILPAESPGGGEGVACTMEAKICPDGSSVGRVGPDCEFAPCPGE